ncbi:unnamed protein product [Rotaria socialis]|nr:unnamed protein product [Rotaria socialis]
MKAEPNKMGFELLKSCWDVDVFVAVVNEKIAFVDWVLVVKLLDRSDLAIKTRKGFELIMEAFKKGSKRRFPISVLFSEWSNPKSQYMFVSKAVSCLPDVLNFAEYSELKRIVTVDELTTHNLMALPSNALNSLDLIATFIRLHACTECQSDVNQFLINVSVQSPELLLLGLAQLPTPWSAVHTERTMSLVQEFVLGTRATSDFVLKKLWHVLEPTKQLLLKAVIDVYNSDSSHLARIFTIFRNLNQIPFAMQSNSIRFALDFVVYAAEQSCADLVEWLNEAVKRFDSTEFCNVCLALFTERVNAKREKLSQTTVRVLADFLKNSEIQVEEERFTSEMQNQIMTIFGSFYSGNVSVHQLISLVYELKQSPEKTIEHDKYLCLINIFLEEQSFFPTYPDTGLRLSALFLGALLGHKLLTPELEHVALGLLVQIFLENTEVTKMFKFAATVTCQFAPAVRNYKPFFRDILAVPSLLKNLPELAMYIDNMLNLKPFRICADVSLIENLDYIEPVESLSSKIIQNLHDSSLKPQHYRWFSRLLVTRTTEANLALHLSVLKQRESIQLYNCALYDVLLLMDTVLNGDSDVKRVQVLGSFLGFLTIQRNLPIKQKHVGLKELLLDGYESDLLSIAVPFVCKVLQTSKGSMFTILNPWMNAVLSTLAEIHRKNANSEISDLLNDLNFDTCPSDLLKARKQRPEAPNVDLLWAPEREIESEYKTQTQYHANYPENLKTLTQHQNASVQAVSRPEGQATLANLASHVAVSASAAHFVPLATLKRLVCSALERTITSIITNTIQQSLYISTVCTREMVKKDFALESDESKMRIGAHNMVKKLAISLAQFCFRDTLTINMITNLRHCFNQNGFDECKVSDSIITVLAQENCELAALLIENAALKKVEEDIDEELQVHYNKRRLCRENGQQYCELSPEHRMRVSSLPEPLRIHTRGLSKNQLAVYDDFGLQNEHTSDSFEAFNNLIAGIELLVTKSIKLESIPPSHELRELMRQVPLLIPTNSQRDKLALHFCSRIVKQLFQSATELGRDVYANVLKDICLQSMKISMEILQWLLQADDERKLNPPAFCALIKAGLLKLGDLDLQLSKSINIGRNTEFAIQVMAQSQMLKICQESDWFHTLDALKLRKPNENVESRLRERLLHAFADWIKLYQNSKSTQSSLVLFVIELQKFSLFTNNNTACLFFRLCAESSVDAWEKSKSTIDPPLLSFQAIDAFAKLIVMLTKFSHDSNVDDSIELFTKILTIILLTLVKRHESMRGKFNQRPWFRMFVAMLHELKAGEFTNYNELMNQFALSLHSIQPLHVPGFTFSWLTLISHRFFLPQIKNASEMYLKLISDLLLFLSHNLKTSKFTNATRVLYKGTLRLLLVILHDFPEFLCDNYHQICSLIAPHCLQLRNLILSAYPRGMRLIDPFTPNLSIDLVPDVDLKPLFSIDFVLQTLMDFDIDPDNLTPINFVKTDDVYNVKLINAFVFMSGYNDDINNREPNVNLIHSLLTSDSELCYHVLSAIANNLRYPNSHTKIFSKLIVSLFELPSQGYKLQELITRVLFERLIVNRPHPWGLLVTFIEIIKNPKYNFENLEFTKCEPDIQALFESVAKKIEKL